MLAYLRPNWKKLTVSAAGTLIYLFFVNLASSRVYCDCVDAEIPACTDYFKLLLFKDVVCHCGCIPLAKVITQYIVYIFAPFVIVYLMYSLMQLLVQRPRN
ncbi:MAG: hypothetical protein ABIA93_00080 [Candidatus Woesearchaeota archaeon]